jgi:hypothetical protein
MNERIKLLAEQSGSTHKQNLGVYQFYADELEKFAQLIVGECIRIDVENPDAAPGVEIAKHFGVE